MIYDEDKEQENKINKENAKLLFTPKFIPFYPHLIKLWLWLAECLVYGFIDFYLQSPESRFYFTNEQIGGVFWLWEQHISNCIKSLKDKDIIKCEYKVRSNGWKIRFIQLKQKLYSDYNNNYTQSITKVIDNNNKINNNKINNIAIYDFEMFWKSYPHARKWKKEEAKKYFMQNDSKEVDAEVKLLLRKVELWLQDTQYIPACNLWIRDFVSTNATVKEMYLKNFVFAIMENKTNTRAMQSQKFISDFWADIAEKYRKEWSKAKNGLTIKLDNKIVYQ